MSDLINRQEAIDKFKPWLKVEGYSEGERNMLKAVLLELQEFPPVEPERKKGKWICLQRHHHKCSVCGNFLDFRGVNAGRGDANFCPNCGAEMKGEAE